MKRIVILIVLILIIASLLCFLLQQRNFFLNKAKEVILQQVKDKFQIEIEIEKVSSNRLLNSLLLEGITISTKEPLASAHIKWVKINFNPFSLIRRPRRIKRVEIEKPVVTVDLEGEGYQQFSFLNENKLPETEGAKGPFLILDDKIEIRKGELKVSYKENDFYTHLKGIKADIGFRQSEGKIGGDIFLNEVLLKFQKYSTKLLSLKGLGNFQNGVLDIKKLKWTTSQSNFSFSGKIEGQEILELKVKAGLSLNEIDKIFLLNKGLQGKTLVEGKLKGTFSDPEFIGNLKMTNIKINKMNLPTINTACQLRKDVFKVDKFETAFNGGSCSGKGQLSLEAQEPQFDISLDFKKIDLSELRNIFNWEIAGEFDKLKDINGRLDFKGSLDKLKKIKGKCILNGEGKYFRDKNDILPIKVDTDLNITDEHLEVAKFELDSPKFNLDLKGKAGYNKKIDLLFSAHLQDLGDVFSLLNCHWIKGETAYKGEITGYLNDPIISGDVSVSNGQLRSVKFKSVKGQMEIKNKAFYFNDLIFTQRGAQTKISGSVAPRKVVFLDLKASLLSTKLEDILAIFNQKQPFTGKITGPLKLYGKVIDLKGEAELVIKDGTVWGERFDESRALVFMGDKKVKVEDFIILRDGNKATGDAVFNYDGHFFANLNGKNFDVSQILGDTGLSGEVDFKLEGNGALGNPEMRGTVLSNSLFYREKKIGLIAANLQIKDRILKMDGDVLEKGNFFSGEIDLIAGFPFNIKLDLNDIELKPYLMMSEPVVNRLSGYLDDLSMKTSGSIELTGNLDNIEQFGMRAELSNLRIKWKEEIFKNVDKLLFNIEDKKLHIVECRLKNHYAHLNIGGEVFFDGGLDISLEGAVNLNIIEEQLKFANKINCLADINFHIGGSFKEPIYKGKVVVSEGGLFIKAIGERVNNLKGEIDIDNKKVVIKSLTGEIGREEIRLVGNLDVFKKEVELTISGIIDLDLIQKRVEIIKGIEGMISVDLRLKGQIDNPDFYGDITVRQGSFKIRRIYENIEEVNGVITFDKKKITIDSLGGKVGRGQIDLEGSIELIGYQIKNMDIYAVFKNIFIDYPDVFKAMMDANFRLQGDVEDSLLSGQIEISKGKYVKEIEIRPTMVLAKRKEFSQAIESEFFKNLRLGLKILARENLWVENNVARIESAVDLTLSGSFMRPKLLGKIEAISGDIFYLANRFKLAGGNLDFLREDEIDPQINVRGETNVRDTEIHFLISGSLSQLSLDLYSDPPHSRENIISLLTIGRTREDLTGSGGEVSAVTAAMVLTGPVINKIEEEARRKVGLDIFQLEPAANLEGKGAGAKVTVGKHLSDRLFVTYSKNVAVAEEQQFMAEYQLTDHISLVGEQNEEGTYNFDIEFKYLFK